MFQILNTFLFLFSNKMLFFRTGIYIMLVRIANREDPDETASSEAVWYLSALFVYNYTIRNISLTKGKIIYFTLQCVVCQTNGGRAMQSEISL